MSMDGLSLNAVLREIRFLKGGRIDKVQQPDRDTLLFTVRSSGRTAKLLICLHVENGRVQLTDLPFENPAEPPMFCMLLRKRLVGSRVTDISQLGLDRYFEITLDGRSELGDPVTLRLCVELMDRHSNLTLVQDGAIVDCLKRVTPDMSPVRPLLPGVAYIVPPAQDKRSPFEAEPAELESILGSPNPVQRLQGAYCGISKNVAKALTAEGVTADTVCGVFRKLRSDEPVPVITYKDSGEPHCVFPFVPFNAVSIRTFPTMSEAYDAFYKSKDAAVRISRNGSSLRKSVEIKLKRAKNKMAMYEESLDSEQAMEQNRLFGELITQNLYAIRRGQSACRCTDYSTDPPQERAIPLDPIKTPAENAQQYFKKYKKAKAAREYASRMIDSERAEVEYLEGQLNNLEKCTTLRELAEIREELVELRYLKSDHKAKPQKQEVSRPFSFLSSDGIPILVGKNNRQNDRLTLHTAQSDNIWLHTKDIPGSHVVIQYDGTPPDRTLNEAAQLAAWYSRARQSSAVPVDYTFRRYVKKPSGAKPGKVIYTDNRTIYVTPEESLILALQENS